MTSLGGDVNFTSHINILMKELTELAYDRDPHSRAETTQVGPPAPPGSRAASELAAGRNDLSPCAPRPAPQAVRAPGARESTGEASERRRGSCGPDARTWPFWCERPGGERGVQKGVKEVNPQAPRTDHVAFLVRKTPPAKDQARGAGEGGKGMMASTRQA